MSDIQGVRPHSICEWGESLTEQSHADGMNPNYLMKVYTRPEYIPSRARCQPTFSDVSEVTDFESGLAVAKANQKAWDDMPPAVRSNFPDPETFFRWAENPENFKHFEALGLIKKDEKVVPLEEDKTKNA